MNWDDVTNDSSKAHHLNLQKSKCMDCDIIFSPEDLTGKHWSSERYPHLHHNNSKEDVSTRPRWGTRCVVCTRCHAKRHNYKFGWMQRWKL